MNTISTATVTSASLGQECVVERRVGERGRRSKVAASEVLELEVALTEGADHAVFGGGTGINRDRHTGTGVEVIAEAIALASVARVEGLAVDAAVERGVDAQITTQLDAGVGARDVEETRAIQGADPHVLDRLGLEGKTGRLSPANGNQTRR